MTISGISQDMLMSITYRMQAPNANNMASRIMKKLDSDEDGTLSTEEINNAGKFAQIILEADTDSDGTVTSDELISEITEDVNNGKIGPPPMGLMQPPRPDDIASHIMEKLDSDGDGILSTEEINNAGELAQKILGADTDGDGSVTTDELVSGITEKMRSRPAPPPMPPDDDDDDEDDEIFKAARVKKLLAQMDLIQSEQADQSEFGATSRILSQMNLSDEESEIILETLQNAGISAFA